MTGTRGEAIAALATPHDEERRRSAFLDWKVGRQHGMVGLELERRLALAFCFAQVRAHAVPQVDKLRSRRMLCKIFEVSRR